MAAEYNPEGAIQDGARKRYLDMCCFDRLLTRPARLNLNFS
jgi:hypothetical protein